MAELRHARVRSVLEVGIGTGRVAWPLTERGLTVTGADVSLGMLSRAHRKGLSRLARGSALHLPFQSKSFDAALFFHVLHIVDDPGGALHEADRVSRSGVWALVHPGVTHGGATSERPQDEAHRILREVLLEQGFPVPPRRASPWVKERELMSRYPPDTLRVVNDVEVSESLQSRLDKLAKGGYRQLVIVPPDSLQRAVAEARRRAGDRTITYRLLEALAHWKPAS